MRKYLNPRTGTIDRASYRWCKLEKSLAGACQVRKELLSGINSIAGKLTYRPASEAYNLPWESYD